MESICWQATQVENQVTEFQQEVFQLELTSALEKNPITAQCVVKELDDSRAVLKLNGNL